MMNSYLRVFVRSCLGAALIVGAAHVHAHRLDVAYSVAGGELVLEAWMGRDEPASNAEVSFINSVGDIIHRGEMNEDGVYRWAPPAGRDLTVVVYAGRGHQNEIVIDADELAAMPDELTASAEEPASIKGATAVSPPRNSARVSTQERYGAPERIIFGLTFIFSAAAAWMAYRANRRVAELAQWLKDRDSRS